MGLYIVIELLSILLFLPLVVPPGLASPERFWRGYETGDQVSAHVGLRRLRGETPRPSRQDGTGHVPVNHWRV
jgi:hypothetical protein